MIRDHSIVFISHKPSGARMQLLGSYSEVTFRALLQHVGGKCLKSLKAMIQTKNILCHILRNSLLESIFPFLNNREIKLVELLPQINHSLSLKTPTSNQGHQLSKYLLIQYLHICMSLLHWHYKYSISNKAASFCSRCSSSPFAHA